MPQLGPLPWLVFIMISFLPMMFVIMISEVVMGEVKNMSEESVLMVELKW